MRLLTDQELLLVSGGAPTPAQVAKDTAAYETAINGAWLTELDASLAEQGSAEEQQLRGEFQQEYSDAQKAFDNSATGQWAQNSDSGDVKADFQRLENDIKSPNPLDWENIHNDLEQLKTDAGFENGSPGYSGSTSASDWDPTDAGTTSSLSGSVSYSHSDSYSHFS